MPDQFRNVGLGLAEKWVWIPSENCVADKKMG